MANLVFRTFGILFLFLAIQVNATDLAPPEMAFVPLGDEQSGFENREQWTFSGTEWWLRNVNAPAISVYPAADDARTGAAVLVIPGGGFQFVSMSNEGWPIAEKLVAQGITAVVLKYRTQETPREEAKFLEFIGRFFSRELDVDVSQEQRLRAVLRAKLDAQAALAWMHANADLYHFDRSRIGVLGFSAGAMTAMAVALDEGRSHSPAFLGAIYGDMSSVVPPKDPMPLFVALAADDPLFGNQGFGLIEDWHSAGGATELHWYQGGGHGFGSFTKGTTSDRWFDQFVGWLKAEGFTAPRE